ncbi:MAG: prepilin-type N-terminal cleavage/methylation domain-containing protein [Epsilonproteobacteria bacterium]|nr:prepilin-type N-terminal cleavage/methylation domain-containing protein [Campylobacterota bacterium]
MIVRGRCGFTLIELICYMVLLTSFVVMMYLFLSRSYQQGTSVVVNASKHLEYGMVSDLIYRDILGASCFLRDWDFEYNIFKKKVLNHQGGVTTVCVGWATKPYGFARSQGEYDFSRCVWNKRSVGVVKADCAVCKFQPQLDSKTRHIKAIDVVITDKKGTVIRQTVSLRNRIVL